MKLSTLQAQVVRVRREMPNFEAVIRPSRTGPSRALDQRTRWTPWLDLAPIAAGGLLIALGFAASRAGRIEGDLLYWAGQAFILLPSIYRILSPATDTRSRLTILVGIAGMQSMLAWGYSPDQFRYGDELQHVRTVEDILRSHKLFTANPILPVSPGFPGLEEVTVALMQLSGLSLFDSGVIVASLSHTMLPVALFLAYREISPGRERWPALATLVYTTAPHYSYFEVLFIYSTPALAFLGFTLAATARAIRRRRGLVWIAVAFVPTLLTHHLTVLAGLVVLVVMAIICFYGVSRTFGLRLFGVIAGLVGLTVIWVELASPSTWGYLGAPVTTAINGLVGHAASAGPSKTNIEPVVPEWETAVSYLSAVALFLVSYLGVGITWFLRAPRWVRLTSLLGLIYPGILFIRVTSSNGPELATRGLTYAMLVVALPVAVVIEAVLARSQLVTGDKLVAGRESVSRLEASQRPRSSWRRPASKRPLSSKQRRAAKRRESTRQRRAAGRRQAKQPFQKPDGRRRTRRLGAVTIAAGLLVLFFVAAIVTGLPAAFERLPGHFYVASDESGIDTRVTAVGQWAAQNWGTTKPTVACDTSVCAEWTAYTGATASTAASPVFYAPTVAKTNVEISALSLGWVETDLRWTTQIPQTQAYFANDSRGGEHTDPLPLNLLTKFDRDSELERVYDDGDIRVYRAYAVWRR